MFDAKPQDRDQIALYVQEIETDHKPGPDGNLIAVDKITFGKKGTAGFQNVVEVPRLMKDNPTVWNWVKPLYEAWKVNQTIVRDGLALEAWPAISKGQIKSCKALGLHSVEDIATATDSIREKLGMGAGELMTLARSWVANKDASATANKIAALESVVEQMAKDLAEARATNDALAATKKLVKRAA